MLDVLVFTDSTAAESLNGSSGFQVIARSSGTSPTDEAVVKQQQHLLPSGIAEDEWESHPATCAYARSGDRMYLTRGQSTGKAIDGRLGNQLTVMLMTADPYDILPLRPAQLFSSPAWRFTRPTSKDLPAWEAPVEITDEFDVPGLHELIVDDPWAVSVLPDVLTMLDQTQAERRKRLLIRHPDQVLVMRWVALLSHFLDTERALGFEFRVFTDAPLRSNQHVVGVHPLIAPDLTIETALQEGVNLLDLERHELSRVTPTESASRYARWFISGDPYEALEAIEVGRRWSRHMDPEIAAVAAELATMGAAPGAFGSEALSASLIALHDLAKAGQTDELDAYGDGLADLVASSRPTDSSDLLLIDRALWAVAAVGDVDLAQGLAVAALEWGAVDPRLLSTWSAAPRGATVLDWRNEELRAHAAGLIATGLASVGDEVLPDAFALAGSLDTAVSAAALATPIRRLADLWAADPALSARSSTWVLLDTVTARLEQVLDARLAAADPGAVASLRHGDWDWLSPVPWAVSTTRPMSRWAAVREMRGAGPERRAQVLASAGPWLPSNAWPLLLPENGELAPTEVAGWIKSHKDLDQGLAVEIDRILGDLKRHPAWRRASGGASVLHQIGKLTTGVPAALRENAAIQTQILELFRRAAEARDQPSNAALRRLHDRFPQMLNGLYGEWIAKAVLESRDTAAAVALADGGGQSAVITFTRDKLLDQLRVPTPTAMLSAVRLLDPSLSAWNAAATEALNAVWDDRSAEAIRSSLLSSVDRRLDRHQQDWLDRFLDSQSKGRFARGVARGAKSVFTGRDNKKN